MGDGKDLIALKKMVHTLINSKMYSFTELINMSMFDLYLTAEHVLYVQKEEQTQMEQAMENSMR